MLKVTDIMQSDVVTVSPDTTARYLARLLADEEITGVPVVDGNDELVGVVSSTDLVRLAAEETDAELRPGAFTAAVEGLVDPDLDADDAEEDPHGFFLPEDSPLSSPRLLDQWPESEFDSVLVREIMTPVTFTVGPDTSVPELCEFLVRGRIHRAVVVDGAQLLGIVTSADVLRAVAQHRITIAA